MEVERLILNVPIGTAAGPIIGEAIESELTRLIAEEGLPTAGDIDGAAPVVRGGAVAWRPERGNQAFAQDVARAVHTVLGGSRSRERSVVTWPRHIQWP